jgi:UDP-2,4-diacetamido-2,4,6-trideoxy-beta-L-altropyranose hydrolase
MTSPDGGRVSVRLRPVGDADMRLLWEWANDAAVRETAFHPEQIPWERHVQWFKARQRECGCRMHIITDEAGSPLGQLRIDLHGEYAEVHLSLAAPHRGRGIGPAALREAYALMSSLAPDAIVVARVRPENPASLRAFEKAGFVQRGVEMVNGRSAVRLVLAPPSADGKPPREFAKTSTALVTPRTLRRE